MLNTDTVNRYLEDNALPPNEGYLLKDDGQGVFIAEWDLGIPEPTGAQLTTIAAIIATEKAWEAVRDKQKEMLGVSTNASWRIVRHQTQSNLDNHTPKETPGKMQLIYRYLQDIREADELATPELALAELDSLTVPSE